MVKKEVIQEPNYANLTFEQYEEIKRAELLSFEDADINGKKCILYSKTLTNPKDVESWILYINLQVNILILLKLN